MMLDAARRFFSARGSLEVETPLLGADVCVDEHLDPFIVDDGAGVPRYLQTSPEFAMKRLLADCPRSLFQVTRAFRQDESGRFHNPEFTIVEWYDPHTTHLDQMAVVESLVRNVVATRSRRPVWLNPAQDGPFGRVTYDEAFARVLGVEVLGRPATELAKLADRELATIPEGIRIDDPDAWLNLLLAERVEETLGRDRPEFLYDYPATQAALARIRRGSVDVAERMELYVQGVELCNGYHEITDPDELSSRMCEQARRRAQSGASALPTGSRLERAQHAGLTDCAGVALGFDRLVMLILGLDHIGQVLPFPWDRA